jgi:hypothetical protein
VSSRMRAIAKRLVRSDSSTSMVPSRGSRR